MKTNQIMQVEFSRGVLQIGHKDMFGDMVALFDMGNSYRLDKGLTLVARGKYLSLSSSRELIAKVSEKIGKSAYVAKSRKGGGAWAHLYVLVDAAMYLDVDLKLEIIERFVNDKLLQWRDASGDNFIELNAQVALSAEACFGKPSHNGHYVNLAKIIRSKILLESQGWNNATPKQLSERTRVEMFLSDALKNNLVRDWDHLKELAEKV